MLSLLSLFSLSALAAGPAIWAGGAAPSSSGIRPPDLALDPPPIPLAAVGTGSAWEAVRSGSDRAATDAQGAGAAVDEVFRFRGDKTPQSAPGVELPLAPGYRFRPLTPAEQGRAEDGWRPLGRDGHRSQAPPQEAPREDAVYGYRSDSWFRKYYGDRP